MQFKHSIPFFFGLFFFFSTNGWTQEIKMISTGPYLAWSHQSVAFEVKNTTQSSLLILGYTVLQGEKTVAQTSFLSNYRGKVVASQLTLPLKIEMDDPGPQARLPYPPKTTELGEEEMVEAKVVFPGESSVCDFPILATYDWRSTFTLKVQWVSLVKENLLYKLSHIEDQTVRNENATNFHRGRKYEEFWVLSYDLLKNAPAQILSPFDFPRTAPQFIPPSFLMLQKEFKTLSSVEKQISFSCTVLAPEFDRDQALVAAQANASQAFHSWSQISTLEKKLHYFIPGEVWWYVKTLSEQEASTMKTSRNTTYLYGKNFQIVLHGDWSHELQTANKKGAEEKELFEIDNSFPDEVSSQEKVKQFVAKCQTMHLEVQSYALKGGGTRTVVYVPGNRFIDFLREWSSFKPF